MCRRSHRRTRALRLLRVWCVMFMCVGVFACCVRDAEVCECVRDVHTCLSEVHWSPVARSQQTPHKNTATAPSTKPTRDSESISYALCFTYECMCMIALCMRGFVRVRMRLIEARRNQTKTRRCYQHNNERANHNKTHQPSSVAHEYKS